MKKVLAIALMVTLAVMLIVPALAADGDIVWQMSADEKAKYAPGGGGDDTPPWIKNCGGGNRTLDGSAIKFFDRTNDYDCIDIVTDGNLDAGKVYTVVAKLRSGGGPQPFKFGMGAGPYSEYYAVDAAMEATLTFKLDAGFDFAKNLRIQTNGTTEDFFLDSVIIYEGDPPKASAPSGNSGGNPKTGVETYIFIALGALALAGVGAIVFARKAKA